MKIDPSRLHSIGRGTVGRVEGSDSVEGARPVQEAGASPATRGVDQLALSQRAEEIRAARAALAEAPAVRADRVAQLKAQVQAGTYKVDPNRVAERILNPRI
ncbi:MAG: flagellar biosynthesis anti-sigma factor FlgM [Armatimonadota bacterium]|nr:flagellar biosynthesis anti-sigma factor FlgM [Armatimonadota bacterium]